MSKILLKIGAFSSAAVSIAAALHGVGLPPGADHVITTVGTVAAMIFGYLHPSPTQA